MSIINPFEMMKQQILQENEKLYGDEARTRYGHEIIKQSNNQFRAMSEEQFYAAEALEQQLFQLLNDAMVEGDAAGDLAQEAVELHKRWLRFYWKQYTYNMHAGLAQMYLADERYISYYDSYVKEGATKFLVDAIMIYAERATKE